jgi:hypothetical protein
MEKIIISKREASEVPKLSLLTELPFLGSALELTINPVDFFVKNYHLFGSIFHLQVPNQSFTVIAEPEANTLVIATETTSY